MNKITATFNLVSKGIKYSLHVLNQIVSGNLGSKELKSFSDRLLQAGRLLEDVNEKRRSCLTTFADCFDLVTWLRESIKGK